jgi:hypothetical protein
MYVSFGPGFYDRPAYQTPERELVNLFAEPANRYRDDRAFVLLPTPGLDAYKTLTGGDDIRVMGHQQGVFGDDLFVLHGTRLDRINTSDTVTQVTLDTGTALADTSEASIAFSNIDEMVLVSNGRYYSYDGTTFEEVVIDTNLTFETVVYLDGRFFVVPTNDDTFYWSEVLDSNNVRALNFATAEREGDDLMGALVQNGEILLFGQDTVEFWSSTGDPNLPVQRRTGATIHTGLVGPRACINAGGTIFYVGKSIHGGNRVYALQGYQPQPISTPAIEEAIQGLSAANRRAIKAWTYTEDGHTFAGFFLPGVGSFVFDVTTGEWHKRTSASNHICQQIMFWNNEYIVGSSQAARLYYQRKSAYDEDGAAITRICTTFVPTNTYQTCYNYIVDAAKGVGNADEADPSLTLEWSDDLVSYSNSRTLNLGASGAYSTRIYATRLGRIKPPGRLFKMTFNDPNLYRIDGVRINERAI